MAAMPTTIFELISLDMLVGSPVMLSIDELTVEGTTVLAWSATCRSRHRHAVQARGLRLLSVAASRAGERDRRDRDELLALAAATRNTIRNMRDDYFKLMRQSDDTLARLEDDDESLHLVPRMRLAVRNLLVEREVLANLLNAHPTLRQGAGQLRIAAEETYPEVDSDDEP
jgi:hypothetical protein